MTTSSIKNVYPESFLNAIKLQFLCIFMSFIGMTLDVLFSGMDFSSYVIQVAVLVLYMAIPYMMMRGVDAARFLFVVLEGVSMALYFTSELSMPPFSTISTFVQFPIIGFTVYLLFSKESNDWFSTFKKVNK